MEPIYLDHLNPLICHKSGNKVWQKLTFTKIYAQDLNITFIFHSQDQVQSETFTFHSHEKMSLSLSNSASEKDAKEFSNQYLEKRCKRLKFHFPFLQLKCTFTFHTCNQNKYFHFRFTFTFQLGEPAKDVWGIKCCCWVASREDQSDALARWDQGDCSGIVFQSLTLCWRWTRARRPAPCTSSTDPTELSSLKIFLTTTSAVSSPSLPGWGIRRHRGGHHHHRHYCHIKPTWMVHQKIYVT